MICCTTGTSRLAHHLCGEDGLPTSPRQQDNSDNPALHMLSPQPKDTPGWYEIFTQASYSHEVADDSIALAVFALFLHTMHTHSQTRDFCDYGRQAITAPCCLDVLNQPTALGVWPQVGQNPQALTQTC